MKLYSVDLSPYSARVRMQIYAKGLSDIVIERPADWGTPKFRERLPIGRIPVLDVDGDLMPESAVIAEYLEEVYPQPSLLGETARETAHIRTLARLSDIYLINSIFVLWPQALASNRNEGIVELLAGTWCATSRRSIAWWAATGSPVASPDAGGLRARARTLSGRKRAPGRRS